MARTRTLELGRPAAHATMLARRGLARAVVVAVVAAAVTAVVVQVAVDGLAPLPVAVAAAVVGVTTGRALLGDFHRARVGARSEKRVARVLRRLNAAAVVHGAVVGRGGDADHVVLGGIAAVVETKTGRGRVVVGRDGTVTANGRRMPKAPVEQARRQASGVAGVVGVPVASVVCVVDMDGAPVRAGQTVVCSLAHLPGVLAGLPTVLDAATAQAAARRLHAAQA